MSVVKINAITVLPERAEEMTTRFAARADEVGKADGFEEFQLLRPTDDRTTWLVYTRWRDEDSFQAWMDSRAFGQAHGRGPRTGSGGASRARCRCDIGVNAAGRTRRHRGRAVELPRESSGRHAER
ncbi:MAG TPA: antibiotic biosynthesis monooxygenase family protein [Acidimicrobiales bacterium]|nr:antibiotic biosynthesis monooxygenase family protein [Acidimicrobiales bacterium]